MPTLNYQNGRFVTSLPMEHLYTASHLWLSPVPNAEDRWQVGYTRFALRMLGEIVEVQLNREAGAPVATGDIVGSIEGFKAISDIYSVGTGKFLRGNPVLAQTLSPIAKEPYQQGWIYEFEGTPEAGAMEVHAYGSLLDETIERLLQKQSSSTQSNED